MDMSTQQIEDQISSGQLSAMEKISELHPAEHQYECATCAQYWDEYDATIHESICESPNVTGELQAAILDSSLKQDDADLTRRIAASIIYNPNTSESGLYSVCEISPLEQMEAILEHPSCSARVREKIREWL